jgi:hypothetical protein
MTMALHKRRLDEYVSFPGLPYDEVAYLFVQMLLFGFGFRQESTSGQLVMFSIILINLGSAAGDVARDDRRSIGVYPT